MSRVVFTAEGKQNSIDTSSQKQPNQNTNLRIRVKKQTLYKSKQLFRLTDSPNPGILTQGEYHSETCLWRPSYPLWGWAGASCYLVFPSRQCDFFRSLGSLGSLGLQAEIGADVAIGAVDKANLSLEEGHLTDFGSLLGRPALYAPDLTPTPSRLQLQEPFPFPLARGSQASVPRSRLPYSERSNFFNS